MVDCGPSRYGIWRELPNETAEVVVKVLDTVFFEHGPVDELLMDNSTAFRSQKLRDLLDKWGVRRCFRAAYRPSGNGIVERHHRTIKAMAERGGISPIEAVFWYNVTPRQGQSVESVPQLGVFTYLWRHPLQDGGESQSTKENPSRVVMGEEVWVKPADGRCTTQWKKGRVTGINSNNNVSVDGMPRHILDLRKVVYEACDDSDGDEGDPGESEVEASVLERVGESVNGELEHAVAAPERRYPSRERKPPFWFADYEVEDWE